MSIIASAKTGGNFEPVSEGVHCAACIAIIDLGDQFNDKFGKLQHKVMFTWEFPDETVNVDGEDKPRVLSKEYTLSLSEKATLRAHLEAWRGKKFSEKELEGFDLKNVLGKTCQIQIIHTEKNGNTYANIAAIMSLPKGMPPLAPINSLIYFDLSEPNALNEMEKLSSWIQDKIKESETYKQITQAHVDQESGDFVEISEDGEKPLPF